MSVMLQSPVQNFGRQLMASRDVDMDSSEDRPVTDSRSSLSTPGIGPQTSDLDMTDKQSPRPMAPLQQTIASYWSALKEVTQHQPIIGGGGLDALLQKYGPSSMVEPPRTGAGPAPFSMGLQLLQQCVEKSLTEAQKAPSLAPLGATHELRNPAPAVNHRLPLVPIDSNDVSKMASTDGQEESYSCHICSSFTSENYEDFRRHVTTHFEHQCDQCDYSSRTESRLKKHVQDVHGHAPGSPPASQGQGHSRSSSTKVFRCRQCSFVAPSKTDYWIHGRIHMRQDRMLQCPRCPFITEYKHHLEYHLRNHLGSKPFKCSKCNYACVNKSMLNSHMKSHTNVYQYRCMDCSYASKYCHSLKVHLEKTAHRPASILNPDGSLPSPDAAVMVTGASTEAINHQMPIRRRKNGASATPISYADMAHTIGQASAAFAMAGQSPPATGAWPPRQSLGDAPPPLIPIANMAASVGGASSREFACTYCPFTTSHYVLFQQHLAVSHLAPMAMRAFPFAVAPPQVTSPASRPYPSPHSVTPDFSGRSIVSSAGSFMPEGSGELSPRKRAYSLVEARAAGQPYDPSVFADDDDRKRSYSFAVNRPLLPPNYYDETRYAGRPAVHGSEDDDDTSAQSCGRVASPDYEKVARQPSADGPATEQPLDLSGAATTNSSNKAGEGAPYQSREGDSHLEEYMDVANSHLPPRKRCRKGKAYKLDMTAVVDDAADCAATSPTGKVMTPPTVSGDLHLVPSSPTADDLDLRGTGEATCTPPLPLDKKPVVALPESLADDTARGRRVSFDAESVGGGSYGSVDSPSRSLPESLDVVGKAALEARASGQGTVHECRHCDMAFGDYFMYMMHKGYHGYQDPFTCNICGERTNNKLDFFLHIARVAHG